MFSDADEDTTLLTRKARYSNDIRNNVDEKMSIHALADGELSIQYQRQLMEKLLTSPALLDELGCILKQTRIIRDHYPAYIRRNSH